MATLWNHVANLNQADKQEAVDRAAAQRIAKKNEDEAAAEAAAACNLRINDKVIYTSADGRNSFEATIVHIGVLTDNDYTITFLGEAGVLKDKSTVRERLRLGGSGGVTATEQASTSTSTSTESTPIQPQWRPEEPFVATHEWQVVESWHRCPRGLQFKMDFTTGKNMAKLM